MKPFLMAASVVLVVVVMVQPAGAQDDRCAACHLKPATSFDRFVANHVAEWGLSPHRGPMGCHACHRGNPATGDLVVAHQSVLGSGNPASPVFWPNIPAMCGGCHPGPFAAFKESRHFALLQQADYRAPTCATCHGEVAARLLSPGALEERCAICHGDGQIVDRAEFPARARSFLEIAGELRMTLSAARVLIDRMAAGERRTAFEQRYLLAQVPLMRAVEEAHRFVYGPALDRLDDARRQTDELFSEMLTPSRIVGGKEPGR